MPRRRSCDCGSCRKCKHADYMRLWYQRKSEDERREWVGRRDPEKVRAADRARYERDKKKRQEAGRVYLKTEQGRAAAQKANREWVKRNPEKRRAQNAATNAVRDGRLVKGPCAVCGATSGIHGHHDDYGKPLEVRWLCSTCHAAEHKQTRRAA